MNHVGINFHCAHIFHERVNASVARAEQDESAIDHLRIRYHKSPQTNHASRIDAEMQNLRISRHANRVERVEQFELMNDLHDVTI